ncbi:cytochrome c oxidase subunit I [Undibacterium terreum]|uniref:Cytochrome c oxidase subunit I n=2 Tax=Undibacterium terreum TaxID=1224302 RepID=A0A916UU57_9BURK|nr:cytochrome c oxidase subunit I [Undibacterium terreum]
MEKSVNKSSGRWKLFLIVAVCAAPMVFSYLAYYVIKPEGRTNYGAILDPRQYPMPKLGSTLLGGESKELDAYKGKWIMLQADSGDCAEACKKKLYDMRQLRLIQGKEMDRIERVWLITDDKPIDTVLIREYDGTRMLQVKPELLKAWLPTESGTSINDHIYMIDPLGNLMMRFPKDADPNKVKKDIIKLLKASAIG